MFSSFTDTNDALTVNRLGRIQAQIVALQLSTREDYMAQLTSMVNWVLNQDYEMQELITIAAQTPAFVGDPMTNMTRLNNDCGDIADEIARLENNASVLYNLAAASQNAIRQQIREGIYASTANTFTEAFINQNQISASSATLDFVAGRAMSNLINEKVLAPTIVVGANSVGSTSDSISSLFGSNAVNLFTWTGELLEIIVSFPAPTVVNRLTVTPDDYRGYEITTLTISPDGSLFTDVLADLGVESINLNAAAGKYSGAAVVDFSPRSVSSMRIVLENRVDGTTIPLRTLTLTQRSYQPSASITSNLQTSPTGQVLFEADSLVFSPYVSITHQISTDGITFTTIQPGVITLPANWWYRALLSRSSTAFNTGSQPIIPTTADPSYSSGFTLASSTSTVISPNTIQRTLVFENVTAAIPLRETPLPGTITISQGTVYLTKTQYSLDSNNNLSFPGTLSSVTVSYQTSAQGSANMAALQQYFTAFLNQVSFQKN